jgi:SAM-dependent methyltransferase
MAVPRTQWSCPICGAGTCRPAFRSPTHHRSEVAADEFAPSASGFGTTVGEVVRCGRCRHGSLRESPADEVLAHVYAHVEDQTSVLEEQGQVATAHRDLSEVARHVGPERRRLLDIGCWTGSLLRAASDLGWGAEGIDPSAWAVARAIERGHRARQGVVGDDDLDPGTYQVITCCDVLEHLTAPADAVAWIVELLEPGGFLFATVPDAGSRLARALGRRWWSVLPMHVQYFTRDSLSQLLRDGGLTVEAMHTHPKVFTRSYYGDRFGEFVPVVGPVAARVIRRSRGADRPFGPDFRDRIAVLAQRPPSTDGDST